MLIALTFVGLLFQSEDRLNYFLSVTALQSGLYAIAVWLAWNDGLSQKLVLWIVALAVAVRVPVLLAPPYLSTDVYRYVWDGHVEGVWFNPYRYAPEDPQLSALRDSVIYPQVASKSAPAIYPPMAEAVFFAVARVSESVMAMKIAMTIFDLTTVMLLARLLALEGLPTTRVLVYAWHPLPIWEFAGSGHIDAALITWTVAALWAVRRPRTGIAGVFLAAATLTKIYPAVLAPALYRRWGWKMPAFFALTIAVAYLPFFSAGSQILGFLPGYVGQEGFNAAGAGFYFLQLLRELPALAGLSTRAYQIMGLVALAALAAWLVLRRDADRPPYRMAAIAGVVFTLLVSPHYPWYFVWLTVFICFDRSFALLWLTNACVLLYLNTGYAFLPSNQALAIQSMIYGPFVALALIDLWCHRAHIAPRS